MNVPEFDELLDAYFLGDATAAEQVRLKESLLTSAESRHRFVEAALLEARLHAARATTSGDDSAATATDTARNLPPRPRGAASRFPIRLRQLDLAAIVVVAAVVVAGYYFIRPATAPNDDVAVEVMPIDQRPIGQKPIEQGPVEKDPIDPREPNVTPADDGSVAEPDGKSRRLDGLIQAVDGEAKTFVVAGPKESRPMFQVAVAASPPREPTLILLDGVRSTFDEAIRSNRRATVIFLPASDGELWVWKVEVSSQAR
jgi:hypothetical protein